MYNAFFKNTGAPFSLDTVDSAIAEGNLDKSGQDYVAEVMRVLRKFIIFIDIASRTLQ